MRSEQIHRALAQGHSRFQICQLVSKGIKITHKPGSRLEDSIGSILGNLGFVKGFAHPAHAPGDAGAARFATRF